MLESHSFKLEPLINAAILLSVWSLSLSKLAGINITITSPFLTTHSIQTNATEQPKKVLRRLSGQDFKESRRKTDILPHYSRRTLLISCSCSIYLEWVSSLFILFSVVSLVFTCFWKWNELMNFYEIRPSHRPFNLNLLSSSGLLGPLTSDEILIWTLNSLAQQTLYVQSHS